MKPLFSFPLQMCGQAVWTGRSSLDVLMEIAQARHGTSLFRVLLEPEVIKQTAHCTCIQTRAHTRAHAHAHVPAPITGLRSCLLPCREGSSSWRPCSPL